MDTNNIDMKQLCDETKGYVDEALEQLARILASETMSSELMIGLEDVRGRLMAARGNIEYFREQTGLLLAANDN